MHLGWARLKKLIYVIPLVVIVIKVFMELNLTQVTFVYSILLVAQGQYIFAEGTLIMARSMRLREGEIFDSISGTSQIGGIYRTADKNRTVFCGILCTIY